MLHHVAVWCIVLQCVECSVLHSGVCSVSQSVAVCCICGSVWQCVTVCCSVSQCVAVFCSMWQRVSVCGSVLQCMAACSSVEQCVAVCCSVLLCVECSIMDVDVCDMTHAL